MNEEGGKTYQKPGDGKRQEALFCQSHHTSLHLHLASSVVRLIYFLLFITHLSVNKLNSERQTKEIVSSERKT